MDKNRRDDECLAVVQLWIYYMGLKRKKKKSLSSFQNKCWKVFSEYIRLRDADENGIGSCISCGIKKHWKELQAGHYVAKSLSLALRFHVKNVHPQCVACNLWRHGNPTSYALALKRRYGDDILEELDDIRRTNEGMRYYESDYCEMIEKFENELENLKQNKKFLI